jgi:metal-responsive CopG/Arc/MetJ family transcriptional regulator
MAPKGKKPLRINIDAELLARIDNHRFDERLLSRSEAIEGLLRTALDLHEAQARWAGHEAKRPASSRRPKRESGTGRRASK